MKSWITITLCAVVFLSCLAGCGSGLKVIDKTRLTQYDSIIVNEVIVGQQVTKKQLGPLLQGATELRIYDTSKKWKLGKDFDLDALAVKYEAYATTPGTYKGKPIGAAITKKEFLKKYEKAKKKLASVSKSKGTNPLHLRITMKELKFPDTLDNIVWGSRPELICDIALLEMNKVIATTEVKSHVGLPQIPVLPYSMGARGAKQILFDSVSREVVLKLVGDMAKNIVSKLDGI